MFVIVQSSHRTVYQQIFATEADARAAIARSQSTSRWSIYELSAVATVQRSSELVAIK
jgi:anti-sigma-K factor RskA